jgi:transcriptional regulator with XRE-family HTH domain
MSSLNKDVLSSNKIAKNIKNLRQAYGETQQELADTINVSVSAIANYEKGDRQVDLQKLQAIATHYRCTLEQLVRVDISSHQLHDSSFEYSTLIEVLKGLLPLFCSDKALSNDAFKRAYESTLRMWEAVERSEEPTSELVDACFDNYEDALGEPQTVELIANFLNLLFLFALGITADENDVRIDDAIRKSRIRGESVKKKLFLRNREHDSNSDNVKEKLIHDDLIHDFYELTTPIIQKLMAHPEWVDLAHYYISLRYFTGLVVNDFSDDFNNVIGMEMMKSLVLLGNSYAENLVSFLEDM